MERVLMFLFIVAIVFLGGYITSHYVDLSMFDSSQSAAVRQKADRRKQEVPEVPAQDEAFWAEIARLKVEMAEINVRLAKINADLPVAKAAVQKVKELDEKIDAQEEEDARRPTKRNKRRPS